MSPANGVHMLGDTPAASPEVPSPVVGSRRCRITRPIQASPDLVGQWGRAWAVDLATARTALPVGTPPDTMVAHWVLEAPWSSEVVHSYSLVVAHLRFDLSKAPVVKYTAGATHELALMAIHPMANRDAMLRAPTDMDVWLRPVVFAAHLVAESDYAAVARARGAVELVCAGRLSPHPTHVRAWASIFGDNMMSR